MNKIEKFIKDNKLDFTGTGSDLNGNCVILAGYALYLGYTDYEDVLEKFDPDQNLCNTVDDEFARVFAYANKEMYGQWWGTEEAEKMYKF